MGKHISYGNVAAGFVAGAVAGAATTKLCCNKASSSSSSDSDRYDTRSVEAPKLSWKKWSLKMAREHPLLKWLVIILAVILILLMLKCLCCSKPRVIKKIVRVPAHDIENPREYGDDILKLMPHNDPQNLRIHRYHNRVPELNLVRGSVMLIQYGSELDKAQRFSDVHRQNYRDFHRRKKSRMSACLAKHNGRNPLAEFRRDAVNHHSMRAALSDLDNKANGKRAVDNLAMPVGFRNAKNAHGRHLAVKNAWGHRGPIKKLSDQLNSDHPDVSYSNFPSALSASRDVTLTAENPGGMMPREEYTLSNLFME